MRFTKLATDDKVDLMLPPWGSAMNFAIAPVATKHGYPMIGPTAISGKFKELALPYFYTMLVQPEPQMQAVAAKLKDLREQGKIKKVAVAYVNDLFGIELNAATGPAFKAAGLEVVDTKSYPLAVKDLSPVLRGFKAAGADAFVGLTYPPDHLVTGQTRVDWNGIVVHRSARSRSTATASRGEVMGIAGWNQGEVRGGPRVLRRAREEAPEGPDRWAARSPTGRCRSSRSAWAGSASTTQDQGHARLRRVPDGGRAIKFTKGENVATPGMIGQWQKNEFELVWPKSWATGTAVVPKPAWA